MAASSAPYCTVRLHTRHCPPSAAAKGAASASGEAPPTPPLSSHGYLRLPDVGLLALGPRRGHTRMVEDVARNLPVASRAATATCESWVRAVMAVSKPRRGAEAT